MAGLRAGWYAAVLMSLSAPALVHAQQASIPLMSLERVILSSLAHSPQTAQAAASIRNAQASGRTAFGAYLPTLSVSTGSSLSSSERFNPQTNTTVTGSNDSYNAGLNASVDVYTGGRRGAVQRQAEAELVAATVGSTEAEYAVVLNATRAYFTALRSAELIRVAETQLRRAEEGLDAAQRRMDFGSATRSDVLRSQLEVTRARQSVLDATNQYANATFALGRLVGEDGPVGAEGGEALEIRPVFYALDELVELVVSESPSVLAANASLGANEAAERAARTQYLPSIRATGGYNWFNQDPSFDNGRTSWQLGLNLSYPIFNGFQREASVERARVATSVAEAQLADARRAARVEVERIHGALRLAEQRIALNQEALAVAEEDLRVQEERYRLGSSTILDLIASQTNLTQAETDLVASRFDYHIARAELEALAGRDL
jgi:outer membrane protein